MKKPILVLCLSVCSTIGLYACQGTNSEWADQTRTLINSGINTVLGGQGGNNYDMSALSMADISDGLKEALFVGSEQVVQQLGRIDGFNLDSSIRIPLPRQLQKVDDALSVIGMNSLTQDLELRLNRAAEAATPRARDLFFTAIRQMTFDDAKTILTGPQDAATQYLRRTMGPELQKDIRPIIQTTLTQAGAIKAYDSLVGQYANTPFVPDVKADLQSYATEKTLDGIFYYVAKEEAAIRVNPAKRTSEILRKVFGAASTN